MYERDYIVWWNLDGVINRRHDFFGQSLSRVAPVDHPQSHKVLIYLASIGTGKSNDYSNTVQLPSLDTLSMINVT